MKNVLVGGVLALVLVGCGSKEDVVVVEDAPAVEAAAPAEVEVVESSPAEEAVAPATVDGAETVVP